jgi:hypothetical protein
MSGTTPIYGLKYPLVGEPIDDFRAIAQSNAQALEALLQGRAIAPPAASDLAALAGRVSAIETAPVLRVGGLSTSTALSIPTGAWTNVALPTVEEDTTGGYTPSTGKYTATRAGLYECSMTWAMQGSSAGRRMGACYRGLSGAPNYDVARPENARALEEVVPIATQMHVRVVKIEQRLNVGDWLQWLVYQDAGAALSLTPVQSMLSARWVRP